MITDERQNQILSIIKERNYVSVEELAKSCFASQATIRRDLNYLEQSGLVHRVRGGASCLNDTSGEISSLVRKQTNAPEKRRIAAAAARFLTEGGSYFLDSSTTVGYLVPHIAKINDCTIITNSLESALHLSMSAKCQTYICGGLVQAKAASSIGGDAAQFVQSFNSDVFFFSCHGLDLANGPTEGTVEQAHAKQQMLKRSRLRVLMIDHTKLDVSFVATTCSFRDINVVISDMPLPEKYEKLFRESGTEIIIAD